MPVMQIFFALALGLASLGSLAFAVIARRPQARYCEIRVDRNK